MLQVHEPCISLLRKHPIDSDANFQVEVEAHGDNNLMDDGQYNYFTFSRSTTGNLTTSFTKCYSSKNWGLALTLKSDYISAKLFV